ncbi:hypothetical protein SAMN05216464_1341 [Mucilaginibacter pineti]|uniref:Methylamine utilisation protein MauE domain-containing protein n=1 Tax=Mucilaginibacter pineti TaxID=1391627 RepID=A0A1G7P3M4_9SPHI|nr:hypothetical protein SAMN05216464_1341 [Mucilaginibacter pineti]
MRKEKILTVIVLLMAALFFYASIMKLIDIDRSRIEMMKQVFPRPVANILVWAIPVTEIIVAIVLLYPKTRIMGLFLALTLMFLFTGYIILVLAHYFRVVPCSCGGILEHMTYRTHIVFNIFFLLLSLSGIIIYYRERRVNHQTS